MVDAVPAIDSRFARHRLSLYLRAVLVQHRLRRQFGSGSIVIPEVLLNTAAVAGMIREDRSSELNHIMKRSRGLGMCILDDALFELVEQKVVSAEDAYAVAEDKGRFEPFLRSGTLSRKK